MADTKALEQRLAGVDLFAGLSSRVLRQIAEQGNEVVHPPGHNVATEGDSGVAFHLLLDGSANVEVGGARRRTLSVGDYFGEISMLDKLPRSATVRAGEQGMRTFALSAWKFGPMLDANPEIARILLIHLCGRLMAAEKTTPDS